MSHREPGGELSLDTVFSVLRHPVRRRILSELQDADEIEPAAVTESTATELYHRHGPHLEAVGLVEWEREAGTIRPGPRYETIEPVVTVLTNNRDRLPGEW